MQARLAGLQNLLAATNTYDKTKTSYFGNVFQKTLNSQLVLGPQLSQFIDTFTQAGVTPSATYFNKATGRMFVMQNPAAGLGVIALYTYNATAVTPWTYVGKVQFNMPAQAATTFTFRGLRVNDSNATYQVVFAVTGSVAINGGMFYINGLTLADFVPVGFATLGMAIGSNQKGVYFLQDPAATGVNQVTTTAGGAAFPFQSVNAGINTKAYLQNGASASLVLYAWDLAGTPTVANQISGVSAQTTLFAGTAPAAFFSMGATADPFSASDPVILTGTVPTNFTASTASAQTAYFIRDIQTVGGVQYFNLALTSAGAAVTPASAAAGMTIMRAFGTSTNLFSFKTGTLPALAGTILQADSFAFTIPVAPPSAPSLAAQDCFFIGTTTNCYLGKISEITAGVTTWSSLATCNLLGTGTDITAPTASQIYYSGTLDKLVYITNTATIIVKPFQNGGALTAMFGGVNDTWLEGINPATVNIGAALISDFQVNAGYLFLCSTTVGQRGIIFADLASDTVFGNAYVVSPVLNITPGAILEFIGTLEQYFANTNVLNIYVRSATTAGDATFATATGGWISIAEAVLIGSGLGPYFQFKVDYDIMEGAPNTPGQINDVRYTAVLPGEGSPNWEGSADNTTQNGVTPQYVAFRMLLAYGVSVPKLFLRGYDDAGSLRITLDTVTNAGIVNYSTNNGTSWNALGTIPNTPFTTEVRFQITTPPVGVTRLTWAISET